MPLYTRNPQRPLPIALPILSGINAGRVTTSTMGSQDQCTLASKLRWWRKLVHFNNIDALTSLLKQLMNHRPGVPAPSTAGTPGLINLYTCQGASIHSELCVTIQCKVASLEPTLVWERVYTSTMPSQSQCNCFIIIILMPALDWTKLLAQKCVHLSRIAWLQCVTFGM